MDKAEIILQYLERNLGPDLKVNTNLSAKVAYTFAQRYIKYVRTVFDTPKEDNGTK
jgi:hypothetical protein